MAWAVWWTWAPWAESERKAQVPDGSEPEGAAEARMREWPVEMARAVCWGAGQPPPPAVALPGPAAGLCPRGSRPRPGWLLSRLLALEAWGFPTLLLPQPSPTEASVIKPRNNGNNDKWL